MIRHHVVFRWTADASDEAKDAIVAGLAELPGKVASIQEFRFGPDAGLSDGNWDFAVSADFADEAGYFAYRDNADHQQLIAERIAPIVAERVAVQIQMD